MADGSIAPQFDALEGCQTVSALFAKRCRELGARTAHREKDYGVWKSYSWTEYFENARLVGQGLLALGVTRGDVVSMLSEDRREWLYYDMGVMAIGAVASGVYTTDSAKQLTYLVNDSASKVLFVENDEQLDKWLEARDEMPGLMKVVVFDRDGLREGQRTVAEWRVPQRRSDDAAAGGRWSELLRWPGQPAKRDSRAAELAIRCGQFRHSR